MVNTLQLEVNNHRYQLVHSVADGIYFIEVNTQRRLLILLSILLVLLSTYVYLLFSQSDLQDSSPANIEPLVYEKHLNINTSISATTYQHPVYLYYDNVDIVETFLPSRHKTL